MDRSPTRGSSDQFLADIAEMRVKSAGRDTVLLRLGAALMPVGAVLGVVAWFIARNTDNPLDQRDAVILAVIGLTLAVIGVGLFVRYSMADFLRFWMARLVYQQQQQQQQQPQPGSPVAAPAQPAVPDRS